MSMPITSEQFLTVDDQGGEKKLHLNEDVLRSYLLSDEVADKPVVVISVAGAFRTGKSFLLNSMTRYLKASDKSRWMDAKIESFPWKSGSEAHTNGMAMSYPIPVTAKSGEEATLVLVDTQGIFDDDSTTTDSTRIFALSTLLSSVQIFNVMNNLKSDDLDNLQLFAEYGRLAKDRTGEKPFNDLLFLVRDWHHTHHYPLGSQGGNDLVEKRLSSNRESLAQRREHIESCFTSVSGFLLPYPGEAVAGSPTFAGDAEDMKPEFITALKELMDMMLSPESLSVKMNGSRPMTCRQLATLIQTYTDLFRSEQLPDAKSIHQAVAEASNMAAVNDELLAYTKRMERLLREDAPMLDEKLLDDEQEKARTDALKSLELRKTMKDPTKEDNHYSSLLTDKMEDWFQASQIHFKVKCNRDVSKAHEANERLVVESLSSFDKSMESVNSQQLNTEQRIRELYTTATEEALLHFSNGVITLGSYSAEQSKLRLENTLERRLLVALERNEEKYNMTAINNELQTYMKRMDSLLDEDAPMPDEMLLCTEHTKAKADAMKLLKTTMKYSTKSDNYYSCLLVERIEDCFKTSINLFQEDCDKKWVKANEANNALVDECISSFNTSMAWLSKDQLKDEKEVRKAANKALVQALQVFEANVVTFGSYTAEDSRTRVEEVLLEASSAWWKDYEERKRDAAIAKGLKIAAVTVGALGAVAAGPVGWVAYAVAGELAMAAAAGGAVAAGTTAVVTGLKVAGDKFAETKAKDSDNSTKAQSE